MLSDVSLLQLSHGCGVLYADHRSGQFQIFFCKPAFFHRTGEYAVLIIKASGSLKHLTGLLFQTHFSQQFSQLFFFHLYLFSFSFSLWILRYSSGE